VINIDFGDCFEVAMTRSKWPEKVPFRLTRMLVNAMEACGIDGTYRHTARAVMETLRQNASSVMAMLEVFVHDPLIKWRLLDHQGVAARNRNANDNAARRASQSSRNSRRGSSRRDEDGSAKSDGDKTTPASASHDDDDDDRWPAGAPRQQWRHLQELEMQALMGGGADTEVLNSRAVRVVERVNNKLTGREFGSTTEPMPVETQVAMLINQATSTQNLACMYIGWCAFW
jgi:FKBP12-rapamycin complex-associated protein